MGFKEIPIYFLDRAKNIVKGIIIAAGMGNRLRPLTKHRPKCMLQLGGKPIKSNLRLWGSQLTKSPNKLPILEFKEDIVINIDGKLNALLGTSKT